MKIIAPINITDSMLLSSNITENDYPAWSSLELQDLVATHRSWSGMCATSSGVVYACVSAGDIYQYDGGSFVGLGQMSRDWSGMCVRNSTIYACVYGGDIYTQVGANFVGLGGTSRNWVGMCVTPAGNVYAGVYGGDIYMQTAGTGAFVALGGTSRNWRGLCATPSGNVYAVVEGGDIYKQTAGTGAFVALGGTSRNWCGICAMPNNDIYACVSAGDIYRYAGESGSFTSIGQTSRAWIAACSTSTGAYFCVILGSIYLLNVWPGAFYGLSQSSLAWKGMTTDRNGNVYASVDSGDIYMQTAGSGNFAALSQTSRAWRGMCSAPNGNVYAVVYGGDIYMQTAGTGDFTALSQTSRNWIAACADSAGNVYACVYGGDIYIQPLGSGDFVALNQTSRNWQAMCADLDDNIYAVVYGGDIYKQTAGVGMFAATGQTSRNWTGICTAPNGDIYASVYGGDAYKQEIGASTFSAFNQVSRNWQAMCADLDGDIYCAVASGDIYKLTGNSGPFYNTGDRCIVTHYGIHKQYESQTDNNYNNYPPTNSDPDDESSAWLELEATNKWRAFDGVCGSQAEKQSSIEYDLMPGAFDSLTFLGCDATSIQAKLTDPSHVGTDAAYGSVTQDNMKISAIDGTAFVDFGVADVLTDGVSGNALLEISDSAGKKISGYIKAAGTGETYGTEKVTNGSFTSDTTGWGTSTGSIASVAGGQSGNCLQITENGTINPYCSQSLTLTQYKLFRWIGGYVKSGTSSTYRMYVVNSIELGWPTTQTATASWVNKASGKYFTSPYPAGTGTIVLRNIAAAGSGQTMLFDEISIQQVLTPSTTGVTITSTRGGSTYNWASKDADFNYNDASGYTYKISIVYNETIVMTGKEDAVKLDIPDDYPLALLEITVNNTSGVAKIGEVIVGTQADIGPILYSPSIGIQSYSAKEVDSFGNYTILKRGYSRKVSCAIIVENSAVDSVDRTLANYIDEAAVFVGSDDYESLIVYGFCKDFSIVIPHPAWSECSLDIEGLKRN